MANVNFKQISRASFDALQTKDNGTLYRVVEGNGVESFYQGTNKLDFNGVNAAEFVIASVNDDIVTIKGLKEENGIISIGTNSENDVVFAKVAVTGSAGDVSYDNTESGLTATDVKGAIDELAVASAGGVDSKTIYFTDESVGQSEFAKVYKLWQGANAPDDQDDPATLIGTINFPKDKVLQDSRIVTITYNNGALFDGVTDVTTIIKGEGTATVDDAGKYMKFIMQNVTDPLYVNLSEFIDLYVGSVGAEITVVIGDDNSISATVNKVVATKVIFREAQEAHGQEGDPDYTPAVAEQTVKAKIDAIDSDIAAIQTALTWEVIA